MMSVSVQAKKYGPMSWEIHKDAHERDLDSKIIITSHNSKPGLGKTTLAIRLARALDPHGWNAEDKAFIDPYDYMKAYDDVKPGSVLILDEIEAVADSRRANAAENVNLSQAWATKRYRNIITISTLPTTSMLDKRMVELSDFRVNVLRRGTAKAFEVVIPDFPPHRPWQEPMEGVIDYNDLPEGDEDYEHLKGLKQQYTQINQDWYTEKEVEKIKERERRQAKKNARNEYIREFYERFDVTQEELAKTVDVSQGHLNKILNA